jgi:autotransporter-associated beta strand protein
MKTLSRVPLVRFWTHLLRGVIPFAIGCTSFAQFIYFEDFSSDTAAGWTFLQGDTNPGPRLTAGLNPIASDPETIGPIDTDGNGWLRMATRTGNQSNTVFLATAIPSSANEVTVSFEFSFWGSSSGTGADGLSVFLYDADVAFDEGANGGSLSYAQKTGSGGLHGGFVGVGLDVWGNYSNATEGRVGSDPLLTVGGVGENPGFLPNQVALRGPDDSLGLDGTGNYYYLAGTGGKNYLTAGDDPIQDLVDFNPGNGNLAFPGQEYRPDQDAGQYRRFSMTLDDDDLLTVSMEFGVGSGFIELFAADLSGYDRPDNLKIGFGAATGGTNQVYEIRNLLISADGLANTWYWTDADVGTNRLWSDADNWNPLSVPGEGPNLYSDVVFSNQFVTSPLAASIATVDGGTDKTLGNLFFSGAYGFTVNADSTERFIFDTNGGGDSVINILNNPSGNADHTVNLDLVLNNGLSIDNLVNQTLTLGGALDTNGNQVVLDTVGTTVLGGVVSDSGGIATFGNGTVRLSGANTYTGLTEVNNGILQIEHASGLGSTSSGTIVQSGGTLALAGNIAVGSESLTLAGTGEGGIGALSNTSGSNSFAGAVTLSDDATIGAQAGSLTISGGINGAGNDLTLAPSDGAALTLAGVITDSTGTTNLLMNGGGEATLSGNNTYSGTTTVNDGTLRITHAGALGDTSSGTVVNSGGSLALSGGLDLGAGEGFTVTGPGDSGTGYAALYSTSGYNEINGTVTITGGSASFGAATGATLALDGDVAGSGQNAIITGNGIVQWAAPMSYTGDTLIQSGTLQYRDAGDRIADTSDIVVSSGATWDLAGFSDTVGSLAGDGNVSLGAGTLTFGGNNNDTDFGGSISGTGGLVKTGTGTLTVDGSNSFTGNLTVTAGVLELAANNTFNPAADLTLNGGTLATDGFANTFDNFSLSASSRIDYVSGGTGSYLTFDDMSRSAGTLTIDNWNGDLSGNGGNRLQVTAASLGGSLLSNIEFTGWGAAEMVNLGGGLYEIVPSLDDFYIWDGSSNDRWNNNNNWTRNGGTPGNDPDANGVRVLFDNTDSGLNGSTIELRTDISVGLMVVDNDDTFTISSNNDGHQLYFNNSGNQAVLSLLDSTTLTIDREIVMQDNLLIANNSSGSLTITDTTNTGFDLRTGSDQLTFGGAGLTIVDSQITESGSVVKKDSGTLRLNDNNTFTGGFTLQGGTVQLGNDNALGNGTIALNGGTLASIGGDRTLNETYTVGGSFAVGNVDGSDLTFSGGGTVANGNQAITVASGVDFTLSGTLSEASPGQGALTKAGDGNLILGGASNSFTGFTQTAGTTTVNTTSAVTLGGSGTGTFLGDGNVGVTGGTLSVTTTSTTGITLASGGTVSNAGGTINLSASGAGADFNLNGNLTHSAGTTTVTVNDDVFLGAGSALAVSGGTVNFFAGDDFTTANNNASIAVSNGGALNLDLSGGATSTFSLAQNDTITVSGPGSALTLAVDSSGGLASITGDVLLQNGGAMRIEGDTTFASVARLDGGASSNRGVLTVTGNLTLTGDTEVINAPGLTFEIADGASAIDATFNGNIANTSIENLGTVTKTGDGVLALGSNLNNVQAFEMVVEGGTLLLTDSNQIANNTRMVLGGGTWDTDGNDEVVGSLTLSATSTLDLGSGDSIVEFADSSGESWSSDVLYITNWSGSEFGGGIDQIYFGDDSSGLGSAQLGRIVFVDPFGNGKNYAARILSTGEIVPIVPEPATIGAGIALVLVAGGHQWWRRRRRKLDDAVDARACAQAADGLPGRRQKRAQSSGQ